MNFIESDRIELSTRNIAKFEGYSSKTNKQSFLKGHTH